MQVGLNYRALFEISLQINARMSFNGYKEIAETSRVIIP